MVRLASVISVFPGQNSLNPAEVPGPLTVISTSPETVSLYVSLTRVEIGSTVEEPETLTDPEIDSSEVLEELIESNNEVRETKKEEVYDDYKKKPEIEIKVPTNTELLEELTEVLDKINKDEVEAEKQGEIPKEVFSQKLLDELQCDANPHALDCLGRSTKNIGKPAHESSEKDPVTTPTTD